MTTYKVNVYKLTETLDKHDKIVRRWKRYYETTYTNKAIALKWCTIWLKFVDYKYTIKRI